MAVATRQCCGAVVDVVEVGSVVVVDVGSGGVVVVVGASPGEPGATWNSQVPEAQSLGGAVVST
jgi:hypothetical protein